MLDKQIEQLDLNLLKTFQVVYESRSISTAAKKLKMSQSGLSRALQRLKSQLGDPLFIRVGNEIEPTPRAHQLGHSVPFLMSTISKHCFPTDQFLPSEYNGQIQIAISGVLMEVIGKPLLISLLEGVPNAQIKIIHWSQGTVDGLENGDIQIGINHYPIDISKSIRQIPIIEDPGLVMVRKNHPTINKNFQFKDMSTVSLAGMVIPELTNFQAIVEDILKEEGIIFKLRCDSLPLLFETAVNTDVLTTCLRLPASTAPDDLIGFIPQDLPEIPVLSIATYYHQRNVNQPMLHWLFKHCKAVIHQCDKQANEKLSILG